MARGYRRLVSTVRTGTSWILSIASCRIIAGGRVGVFRAVPSR